MLRVDRRWQTRFGSWVRGYTVHRLAGDLRLTDKSVYDWVSGRFVPHPSHAIGIVQLAGGAISLEDVYRHRAEVVERTN